MNRLVYSFISMGMLAACASVSTPEDAVGIATSSLPDAPPEWTMARDQNGQVEIGWIEKIGDPALTALVKEAQTNNRDLQAAAASVETSARPRRASAGSALSSD